VSVQLILPTGAGQRKLKWREQGNALIEPDRGRFSNSGRIVAYPDRTAFFGDYFRIGGDPDQNPERHRCIAKDLTEDPREQTLPVERKPT
jgi:hypothetical protein